MRVLNLDVEENKGEALGYMFLALENILSYA